MKIKDLSIGKKLMLGFGIVLLLTAAILLIGWNGFSKLQERYWKTNMFNNIESDLLNTRLNSRLYIQHEQQANAESLLESGNKMLSTIDIVAPTLKQQQNQNQINQVRQQALNYRNVANSYIAATKEKQEQLRRFDEYAGKIMNEIINSNASQENVIGFMNARVEGQRFLRLNNIEDYRRWERNIDNIRPHFTPDIQNLLAEYKSIFEQVYSSIKKQEEGEEAFRVAGEALTGIVHNAVESMESQMNSEISTALYQMILFGVLAIFIGILFAIFINGSIRKGIANGVAVAVKIADGDLAVRIDDEYLNRKDEIGELSLALQRMSDKLNEIISSVITGSGNIASASEQMSSTSQELSQGASEQASSVEEVSSSMEEMASNIQQNTDNAQQTEKISLNVAQGVQKVGAAANESLTSIKNIAEKIGIINDIAFQTNILALNAAVEAARAGEHGRGFAVVAAEVRKLAERSKVAADEIVSLATKSVNVTEDAAALMGNLFPEIEKTAKLVQEITAASIEQSSGSNQINNAIQQLNQVVQQNAAASEEMATGAEELSSQADQLTEIVGYFKLNGNVAKKKHSNNGSSLKKVAPANQKGNAQQFNHQPSSKGNGVKLIMPSEKSNDNDFQNY
ncbi:methyl-accepting chemotaxis protein [Perlabentimonas gracilis]|uniref:methyl-accepting chemotaxis protein n=1 Tax=Perlabentimonas gracilis TaxID=2715279 RepID=UPI00140AB6AE|nr:methyl-accepting chemotaxis protein [Perlabentimonas gracilis]NHB69683.1 HAMP domain-containing protein [Perlabentimonas gracilis]